MANKLDWRFPSNEGGLDGGFNHDGIEYFQSNPRYHLAREIIQNSLDARDDKNKPVVVRFKQIDIPSGEFPGRESLLRSFKQCLKEERGTPKAEAFFREGIGILGGKSVSCLHISDSNTTGLRGKTDRKGKWHNLTKAAGRSAGKSDTAGGSFGIGKNAPFAASSLRVVFYSTSYADKGGRFYYCAQGKAILTSHAIGKNKQSQRDGFYGVPDGCQPMVGNLNIPEFLRRENESGTSLVIAGFPVEEGWSGKIVAAVAANFFCAVGDGKLEVDVDGRLVSAETLDSIFGDDSLWGDIGETPMEYSRVYYRALKEGGFHEAQHPELGHVKLHILVDAEQKEKLPKRTAIARDTGMIITDQQSGFQFRGGFSDYAALCICEGEEANKTLRDMENPEHDKFEPGRLKADEPKGKNILNAMKSWVREKIAQAASPPESEVTEAVELAEFLPDPDAPEKIAGEDDERDIEGAQKIVARPAVIRRKSPLVIPLEAPDDPDDPDTPDDPWEPRKKKLAKKPRRRAQTQQEAQMAEDIRILAHEDNPARKTIKFTPRISGPASMEISIAGDSFAERMKMVSAGKLSEGVRASVEVEFDRPVSDALIVSVFPKNPKGATK